MIPLEAGKSALKLTTASYHRPSGKNIHRFPKATEKDEWGVMPDAGYDLRMSFEEMRDLDNARREREVIHADGSVKKSDFVDKQLNAAIEGVKKLLADGKPIVEQPVERAAEVKKEEEKKGAGALLNPRPTRVPFVDALLEYWQTQSGRRVRYL